MRSKFVGSKIFSLVLVIFMLMMFSLSTVGNVYAEESVKTYLDSKVVKFIEQHDLNLTEINKSFKNNTNKTNINDEMLALMNSAKAYGFNEKQIKQYVKGLINSNPIVVKKTNTKYRAIDRPSDNGIGYEVKSQNGYHQGTAFAIIPTVNRTDNNTSAYMFYTISGPSWGLDVGLWYGSRNYTPGWMGVYNSSDTGQVGSELIPELTPGKKVYFNAVLETDGNLRLRVLDGDDFSKVYYDLVYYVYGHGIYQTNASFNRQITLCQGNKDFSNGSYITNAQFYDAYIYNQNGYFQTAPGNTIANRCGVFGTDASNRYKVQVNSSSAWYEEDINIRFDI